MSAENKSSFSIGWRQVGIIGAASLLYATTQLEESAPNHLANSALLTYLQVCSEIGVSPQTALVALGIVIGITIGTKAAIVDIRSPQRGKTTTIDRKLPESHT